MTYRSSESTPCTAASHRRRVAMPWMVIVALSLAAAPAATAQAPSAAAEAALPVAVSFDDNGPTGIHAGGQPIPVVQALRVHRVRFLDEEGKPEVARLGKPQQQFDPATGTLTLTYDELVVRCRYEGADNRLRLTIDVRNLSDRTLHDLMMHPVVIEPAGEVQIVGRNAHHNVAAPTVLTARWPGGVAAVCNEQIDRPLRLRISPWQKGRGLLLFAQAGGDELLYDEQYLSRPIAPGGEDRYELSVRFGAEGTDPLELGEDVFARFRSKYPPVLDWPDRRPIGRLFFGGGLEQEKVLAYYRDPERVELPTEASPEFRQRTLNRIDNAIDAAKWMDAQAIIIWDIEGSVFPHATTYIGDPRLLPIFNPELNAIADEMFARIHDAGLLSGLTLRPSQIHCDEKNQRIRQSYSPVFEQYPEDPVFHHLAAKIDYARQRWGCRVFYVDTSVIRRPRKPDDQWKPALITDDVWRKLAEKYPDTLIIPEFNNSAGFASVAGYAEYDMGFSGTSAFVRRMYPDAWTVAPVEDADPYEKGELMVRNVIDGDVLMTFNFGRTRNVEAIRYIYQDAGLRQTEAAASLAEAPTDRLLEMLRSEALAHQVHAARALGQRDDRRAVAPLIERLVDAEAPFPVRKAAAESLGRLGATEAIESLVALLTPRSPDLRYVAAAALAQIGEPAVPAVIERVTSSEGSAEFGILALGRLGDARAVPVLAPMLASKPGPVVRRACTALGRIGGPEATAALIELLGNDQASMGARVAAATAPGDIGTAEARQALEQMFEQVKDRKELGRLAYVIRQQLNRLK